jgi:hypothetical protein
MDAIATLHVECHLKAPAITRVVNWQDIRMAKIEKYSIS